MRIKLTPNTESATELYKAPTGVLERFRKESGWTPAICNTRKQWAKRPPYGHFSHANTPSTNWRRHSVERNWVKF